MDYRGRETQLKAIYILKELVKEFIIEFYKEITQGYNRAMALVARLGQEYLIKDI